MMTNWSSPKAAGFMISAAAALLMMAACSSIIGPGPAPDPITPTNDLAAPTPATRRPTPHAINSPAPPPTLTPTEAWLAVLEKIPYPYSTPLPPPTRTTVDGSYVKFEPKEGTPVPCRRCPDYLPESGLWKLNLDRGMYRIFHEATGWFSLGSFTISEDRFLIYNDPTCIDTTGVYTWNLEAGTLNFEAIADTCHVNRRARSFANLVWASCQPPNAEAAVTGHWPQPPGCEGGE